MLSVFRQEHDAQGREVVEIGFNMKRLKALLIALPTIFFFGLGFIMDAPLFVMAIPAIFMTAAVAVIGFPALASIGKLSEVRVTLDSKFGRILVTTHAGQSEIPMAEVAGAEFGSYVRSSPSDDRTTRVYRLEFVKKNGERVPATAGYTTYSLADQGKMVAAVKAALERQLV